MLHLESLSGKAALAGLFAEKNGLKALVKTMQERLAVFQLDAHSLLQMMDPSNNGNASQLLATQNDVADGKAEAEMLAAKLEALEGNLHFTSTGRADPLEDVELQ